MADYDLGTARGTIILDASSLGRASAALTTLGRSFVGIGVVAVGAVALAVKAAADFEHGLSAVKAVSGATEAQMEQLRQKALQLGSSTIYSADEVVSAFNDLAKAGIPVEQILGGVAEAAVHLAAAAGDELPGGLEQAGEVLANTLKVFNAGADQAEHFADVLVAAAASSTLAVDDIATSLKYVGPVAASLGVDVDQLGAVLAELGDRGIKGSIAGTSLRQVFLSLSAPTSHATEVMKELGLVTADGSSKFFDLNGNMKPLPEVIGLLSDATKGLSEEQKLQAFSAIFQRRAMAAALILADQGVDGFNRYAEAMGQLTAADIAATKIDNLSGDMTILKNTLDTLLIRIGEPLQAGLRGIVQGVTGVVTKLNELDPKLLDMVARIVGFTGAGFLLVGSLALIGAGIFKFYRILIDAKAAVQLLSGAFRLLSTTLLTSPWFWVIAAIVLLGVVLYDAYNNVESFHNAVDKAFNAIKDTVLPIVDQVSQAISEFWTVLTTGMTENEGGSWWENLAFGMRSVADFLTTTLIPGIRAFFDTVSGGEGSGDGGFVGFMERAGVVAREVAIVVGQVGTEIYHWLVEVGIPAAREFGLRVAEVATTVWHWLSEVAAPAFMDFATAVIDATTAAIGWIQDNVIPPLVAFAGLVAAVVDKVRGVIEFLEPVFKATFAAIGVILELALGIIGFFIRTAITLWEELAKPILDITVSVFNYVKGVIEAFFRIISGIFTFFKGVLTLDWGDMWAGISEIVGGAYDLIVTIIQGAFDLITNLFGLFEGVLSAGWQILWDAITTAVGLAWDYIIAVLTTAWDTIFNLFTSVVEIIISTVVDGFQAILGTIEDVMSTVVTTVGEKIAEVFRFFAAIKDTVLGYLSGAIGWLVDTGYNIIQGLFNGIGQVWQDIVHFLGGIYDEVLSYFTGAARWLYDIGKAIIGGLIDGIKNAFGALGSALGSVGGFIKDHKGPPEKDAVMLVGAGKLIMQGLLDGMMSGWAQAARWLDTVDAATSLNVNGGVGGGGSGSVSVVLDFSNGRWGSGSAEDMRRTLNDPTTLAELTRSIRAGVGTT